MEDKRNDFWDYVSTVEHIGYHDKKVRDEFKEIMREILPDIKNILDQIYWVNALVLYLNTYCFVSQNKIAEILNISQFGVSKRYRASKNKIKRVTKIPIKSRKKVINILSKFIKWEHLEIVVMYYFIGVKSMVQRITGKSSNKVNLVIDKSLKVIKYFGECDKDEFVKRINRHNIEIDDDKIEYYFNKIKSINRYFKYVKEDINTGSFTFRNTENNKYRGKFESNLPL